MAPESQTRWTRIRALFDRAIELPEDERRALLARECGADLELQREVESLVAADAEPPTALSDRVDPVLIRRALGETAAEEIVGTRIGSYEIRSVLGAGGMGTVFEAVQDSPRRQVALKVMKGGLFGERARRRFEYEAEILARLRHRGIAQIYEAATFASAGRSVPYFAMEFVDGALPLDAFVVAARLDLRQLLVLFQEICAAVEYAHRRGVIHRDLKPGNILVDRQAQPKVIDFGIARPTADSEELRSLHTETGMVLGTMRYMSPEQMDGDAEVDIRTDVYALGVLLYELLTDSPPIDPKGKTIHVMAQLIREAAVDRPSQRRPGLPDDLDWITMRAIARERDERYGSVDALSQDIGRFLTDQPVLAGPPGRVYQLRKFVRRHSVWVGASLAVGLALVIGTVVAIAAMLRAREAEGDAKLAQARTEVEKSNVAAVNRFLLDMIAQADPKRGGKGKLVREVLDSATAAIESFAPDNPELNLNLRATITTSYYGLGEYATAVAMLETAVPMARSKLGDLHPLTLSLINNQGLSLHKLGRFEAAEPLIREALAGRQKILDPDDSYTVGSMSSLASLLEKRGEFAEALELFQAAYRLRAARDGVHSQGALSCLASVAIIYERMGDIDTALEHARRAYAPCAEHLGPEHATTQRNANNLASILRLHGDYQAAADLFAKVLESARRRYQPDHPTVLRTMSNLASTLKNLERYSEAIALFRQLESLRRTSGNRVEAMIAANNLAATLRDDGQLDESVRRFEEVLQASAMLNDPRHWLVGVFRKGYGQCLLRMQRVAEAERQLDLSLEILASKFGDADYRTHNALLVLVELHEAKGDLARAQAYRARLAAKKPSGAKVPRPDDEQTSPRKAEPKRGS